MWTARSGSSATVSEDCRVASNSTTCCGRSGWSETHHSTAIEGSSLSEHDVVAVVERGQARGTLTEALEVKAYADAAGWVYETVLKAPSGIELATIREVHRRGGWAPSGRLPPPATRDDLCVCMTGVTIGGGRRVQLSAAPSVDATPPTGSRLAAATRPATMSGSRSAARLVQRIHPFTMTTGE